MVCLRTKSYWMVSIPSCQGFCHNILTHLMLVFITSFLQKQPLPDQQDAKGLKTSSSLSYHYSGSAYVTQETLWFYSGISSNCITTVSYSFSLASSLLNMSSLIRLHSNLKMWKISKCPRILEFRWEWHTPTPLYYSQ